MGRSNCIKPDDKSLVIPPVGDDPRKYEMNPASSFFCEDEMFQEPWITEDGWAELLRMYTRASAVPETNPLTWELMWLYVPDWMNKG